MVKHLACIMDGNRRWAMKNGLIPLEGHRKGFDAIKRIIEFCLENKIEHLSLYTFSIENLKRTAEELHYLFEVLAHEVAHDLVELKQKNVKVSFIGDKVLFPKSIRSLCEKVEKETYHCTGLYLHFLLFYGGRQEIIDTACRIAIKIKKGDLKESEITPAVFEQFLWTAGIPYPDIIIRTGGDRRLSNFLLFQAAYSELYFLDVLWPDISKKDIESAVITFNNCRKNFGQ
jgi:undecaprenyl diphosphate synthase